MTVRGAVADPVVVTVDLVARLLGLRLLRIRGTVVVAPPDPSLALAARPEREWPEWQPAVSAGPPRGGRPPGREPRARGPLGRDLARAHDLLDGAPVRRGPVRAGR